MKFNDELSRVSKFAAVLIIAIAAVSAIINIYHGSVQRPAAFGIVLLGLVLFIIAKLSVMVRKRLISFGSSLMTEDMANVYRFGYWLMIVGIF